MTTYYQTQLPVNGQLTWLAGTATELVFVGTPGNIADTPVSFLPKITFVEGVPPILTKTASALTAYFNGQTKKLRCPVTFVTGTVLQRQVWQYLLTSVQYGTRLTYSQLAEKVGKPKAIRAVATAVAKNPLLFVLPCHRVVRKDGSVGEYRGGIALKQHLLNIEQQNS